MLLPFYYVQTITFPLYIYRHNAEIEGNGNASAARTNKSDASDESAEHTEIQVENAR